MRDAPPAAEDCARAELLIAAGASSPLGARDAEFLPAHLVRCPSCREDVRSFEKTRSLLGVYGRQLFELPG